MGKPTCIIIKPKPSLADDREKQRELIEDIIEDAIRQTDLQLKSPKGGILVEDDVSEELVRQILESDIIVIDANCYECYDKKEKETDKPRYDVHKLSPFLYYFLGIRHTMGNKTILVSKSKVHLPATLQKHHTLFYDRTPIKKVKHFTSRFQRIVKKIIEEGNEGEPDNPVQAIILHKLQKTQKHKLEKVQAELDALKEREAEKAKRPSVSDKISFKRVK